MVLFNPSSSTPSHSLMHRHTFYAIVFFAHNCFAQTEVVIPAFTAYSLPDAHSVHVSEASGITHWNDSNQSVNWYGNFVKTGALNVKVALQPASSQATRWRMSVSGQSKDASVPAASNAKPFTVDFGSFVIAKAGYHRLVLESLEAPSKPVGGVKELILGGPAVEQSHFNLEPRRNAASVHLAYIEPSDANVEAFYCEVTAIDDPTATFYMACGWHRGYFGMQVNSETERRIIFSVWDSGDEAVDRNKVADEKRVKLMRKGEGVYSGDFGNEGTGGHSHLKYLWKTGEAQRFIVTAEPIQGTFTIFSGYWFHPEKKVWMLISSWKAPSEGGYLRGLHSFSENFDGDSGHLRRKAFYGNQWVRTDKGEWLEVTQASFSHDPTGKVDRLDRFMGIEDGKFFLSHGGFVEGFTKYGEKFDREAGNEAPTHIDLPKPSH